MISNRARIPMLLLQFVVLGVASLLAQSSVTISLTVDATQAPEKILHTRMVMPVKSGPLTVYYPKWIPGEHTPGGPVGNVAGLTFSANGKTLPWRRDLLDVFTFHLDVPPGVERLDVEFDFIESGNDSATDKLVIVELEPKRVLSRGDSGGEDYHSTPPFACPPAGNSGLLCRWRTRRAMR